MQREKESEHARGREGWGGGGGWDGGKREGGGERWHHDERRAGTRSSLNGTSTAVTDGNSSGKTCTLARHGTSTSSKTSESKFKPTRLRIRSTTADPTVSGTPVSRSTFGALKHLLLPRM